MAATNNEDKKIVKNKKNDSTPKTEKKVTNPETKPKKKASSKKVKETGNDFLIYKEKKLVRVGNTICYGNPSDPYVVYFRLENNDELKDITVAKKVIIELKTNEGKASRLIRQAERDGLYKAFDIGMFWLSQALDSNK